MIIFLLGVKSLTTQITLAQLGIPQNVIDALALRGVKSLLELCAQDTDFYLPGKKTIGQLFEALIQVNDKTLAMIDTKILSSMTIYRTTEGDLSWGEPTFGYLLIFGECKNLRVPSILRELKVSTLGELAKKSQQDMEHCSRNAGKKSAAHIIGRLKKLGLINSEVKAVPKFPEVLLVNEEELMKMHPADLIDFTQLSALALWKAKIVTIKQLSKKSSKQLRALGVSAKELGKIKKAIEVQGINIK